MHELALRFGWDAVHPRLHLTKPFYDRFTPAISAADFVLRPTASSGRWTSWPSAGRRGPALT